MDFEGIVGPMMKLRYALSRQSYNLLRTRDLLLPRLMSGQLSVEAAEAAVP
jgi:type I restriction enzyme S subunit